MSDLGAALVAGLDEAALRQLAERLRPWLEPAESHARGWLDSRAAAEYLGLPSVDQLHKLTAARRIAFSQEAPGAKCFFRVTDLDDYRERFMRGSR